MESNRAARTMFDTLLEIASKAIMASRPSISAVPPKADVPSARVANPGARGWAKMLGREKENFCDRHHSAGATAELASPPITAYATVG